MIRARFKTNVEDPRPVNWPIDHPYWVTGYGDDYAIVVAYAADEDEIRRNWPDAEDIEAGDASGGYFFSDRYQKPEWFDDSAHSPTPQTENKQEREASR